jgi:hypothetical protein
MPQQVASGVASPANGGLSWLLTALVEAAVRRPELGRARRCDAVRRRHLTALVRDETGSTGVYVVAGVLIAIPFVALLWVSSYAKAKPELFGFPFFYWYQLMWVLITAALTSVAYALVRGVDRKRARQVAEETRASLGGRP